MAHICLYCGLSQDKEHQRIGLLLFCPFLAHDGPRHAPYLALILGRSSPSYFRQYGRRWSFRP
jgi:hypothetical protein